jgi:hypothetical protein
LGASSSAPVILDEDSMASSVASDTASMASAASEGDDLSQGHEKKKKNRCLTCKKKVGLTGKDTKILAFLKGELRLHS